MWRALLIVGVLLLTIFCILRIIYPVRHTSSGYVVHWYPALEGELCAAQPCSVDRSRTGLEISVAVLLAAGLVTIRQQRS